MIVLCIGPTIQLQKFEHQFVYKTNLTRLLWINFRRINKDHSTPHLCPELYYFKSCERTLCMKPSMYLVASSLPGRLFIMPKPSGEWLAEDLGHCRSVGIDTIVSMLEPDEVAELLLHDE